MGTTNRYGDPDPAADKPSADTCPPGILINEVQLILAEKRTSLASLRTGIAVFVHGPLALLFISTIHKRNTAVHFE